MGRTQSRTELLELVRMMAQSGRYENLLALESALILQGRDEGLDQLQAPQLRQELDEICILAASKRAHELRVAQRALAALRKKSRG